MEKLLQLVEKLKSAIVPDQPVGKMPKAELLSFISESDLLTRMRTFHERVERVFGQQLRKTRAKNWYQVSPN